MQQRRALYEEAGDGDLGSASGAADGGSSEDGQGKPPKDGEWIPKARFDEAIGGLKDKVRDLEVALAKSGNTREADPPKRVTRSELKAAVTAGNLSEDQANDIWDKQLLDSVTSTATSAAHNTITQAERERRVNGDIAAYTRLMPGITQDGHADRARVKEEFDYLVSLGHPKTVETEAAAIRAAFGPIERLERARAGRSGAEHHREAGASGGSSRQNSQASGKLVDTLTEREKGYYQKQIDSGQYKGWDDVEAVLKHANPATRRKHGASV